MNRKIRKKILEILHYRSPNSVREEFILLELREYNKGKVEKELELLVSEGKLFLGEHKIERTGETIRAYRLSSYDNILIRTTIDVGEIEVPRLIDTDKARSEDVNILIESVSKYSDSLEERFRKIMNKQIHSYWSNIILLFGLFIGLFSLITISIKKISIDPNWTKADIFWNNFIPILPVAIVLLVFIIVIKILFRK